MKQLSRKCIIYHPKCNILREKEKKVREFQKEEIIGGFFFVENLTSGNKKIIYNSLRNVTKENEKKKEISEKEHCLILAKVSVLLS